MARGVMRGEIRMYRFDRPNKRRPVLVLSRQAALDHLATAVVAPITAAIRGLPSEVHVGPGNGLKKESVVNLDHLFTVPQSSLTPLIGRLDEKRMRQVCEAAAVSLDCRW